MYRDRPTLTHLPKKWNALLELEVLHPEMTNKQLAEALGISTDTISKAHKNDVYLELYHKACERHFRSMEALAIKGLEIGIMKGKTDACAYVLNYLSYKPADNVNISSGEININITGEDDKS